MSLDSEKSEPDIEDFVLDEYEPEPYTDGYLESYEED